MSTPLRGKHETGGLFVNISNGINGITLARGSHPLSFSHTHTHTHTTHIHNHALILFNQLYGFVSAKKIYIALQIYTDIYRFSVKEPNKFLSHILYHNICAIICFPPSEICFVCHIHCTYWSWGSEVQRASYRSHVLPWGMRANRSENIQYPRSRLSHRNYSDWSWLTCLMPQTNNVETWLP